MHRPINLWPASGLTSLTIPWASTRLPYGRTSGEIKLRAALTFAHTLPAPGAGMVAETSSRNGSRRLEESRSALLLRERLLPYVMPFLTR